MSEVTVQGLDLLCQQIAEKDLEHDEKDRAKKDAYKELEQLKYRAAQYLKELGREDYKSPYGDVAIVQKWRVNMPEDDNAKSALFDHLRERGIFDKYASVHAQSLNSLYMKDWEAAKERGEGMEFSMPGVGAPKLDEKTNFKPKK